MAASSGERISRRELVETIDKQNEQLSRYETRLRDVVRAYKGLAKEKEALEKSLAALSSVKKDETQSREETQDGEITTKGTASSEQSDNESVASSTDDAQLDIKGLKAQVRTLAASLSTLSAEKSTLESQFQKSKKKSIQERSENEKKIDALKQELASLKTAAKKELDETKSKFIVERHNREKESNDHALMLRELQKLVADERAAKEKLENELSNNMDNLKALELAGTFNAEYEKRVRELESDLAFKTRELEVLRLKVAETPPELISLRQELTDVKQKHTDDLRKAEQKSRELEDRAQNLRSSQENRIINLEARLQELSETVGSYDRLRQQDQVSIVKMRERVQQLESEKSAALERLSNSGASSPSSSNFDDLTTLAFGDQDTNLDVQTLIERILRLKSMVREANKRSKHPLDLDELLEMTVDNESAAKWKKCYHQLKDEFESYKLRREFLTPEAPLNVAISGRRILSKTAELDEEEIQNLKGQIVELRNRLSMVQTQLDQNRTTLAEYEAKEKELNETLGAQKQSFKEKLESQELDLKGKVLHLETELQKQRERCLTLIEEKEDEVASLKSSVSLALEAALAASVQPTTSKSPTSVQREAQLRLAAALARGSSSSRNRLMSSSSFMADPVVEEVADNLTHLASHQSDGMSLHYTQELARCEVEITGLRKKNHDLESAMRELQMSFGAKEERYADELDGLRDLVRRLKRMTTKEGANFEYLKNVVLNYMLSSDAASRDHMLKAIGAVLTFSETEIQRVRTYNASWWGSGSTASSSVSRRSVK